MVVPQYKTRWDMKRLIKTVAGQALGATRRVVSPARGAHESYLRGVLLGPESVGRRRTRPSSALARLWAGGHPVTCRSANTTKPHQRASYWWGFGGTGRVSIAFGRPMNKASHDPLTVALQQVSVRG